LLRDRVVAIIKTERYRDLAHHFVDLSKFLDSEPNMFIDGVGHFSPEANKRIAAELNIYFKKNTHR
jgi:hypothetical protein